MKIFAFLVVGLVCAPQIAAARWVAADGNSCDVVCKAAGSRAITTLGHYTGTGGQPYYVCRANANNEGNRAGFNLQPYWSNVCTIGWDGREFPDPNYECLCLH